MNQPHPIGPIEAAQRAEAAERRRRFMAVKTPEPKLRIVPRCTDLLPPPPKPIWQRKPVEFNDHIIAWQLHRVALVKSPIHAFTSEWCADNGVNFADLVTPSRKAKTLRMRDGLIFELRHRFNMSLLQLGRMFKRDHTSILNSLRNEDAKRAVSND